MVRRAFLGLIAPFLALAFLVGTPGTSVGGPSPVASSGEATWAPVIRGSLTQEIPDGAVSQRTDEDNPDDRIVVRASVGITWPTTAPRAALACAAIVFSPTHHACAAPARAPPTT